ncbi:MAG: WD40 repeat domain-containing protein [Planctomycetaceae bacterium]|nr:WD40 repeat domain-containing protein [Planctomycetaceae bacterium]
MSAGRGLGERGHENGVITWNLQTGEKVRSILIQANSGTHMVAFAPGKKLVAIGSRHYDKENDTYSTSIGVAYPLSGITEWQQTISGWGSPKAFSPDGKFVLVQCGGESIWFIDAETGQTKHEIKAADSPMRGRWSDFAVAPQGQRIVIGGAAGEGKGFVEVWDIGDLGDAKPKQDR